MSCSKLSDTVADGTTQTVCSVAEISTVGPRLLESLQICLWKTKTRAAHQTLHGMLDSK